GALTLAEVCGALPRTGGIYALLHEAFGPLPAFLFGWAQLCVIRAASIGAIALTFAEHAVRVAGGETAAPESADLVHGIAAAAIAVTAGVNALGVRFGAWVQNLTVLAKYGGLAFVVVAAFVAVAAGSLTAQPAHAEPAGGAALGAAGFGLALVSV